MGKQKNTELEEEPGYMNDSFSIKSVINKSGSAEKLSQGEIIQLQNCLLTIIEELAEVCEKHDIKLILQGGTLLGHVRHDGFIPWDDDVDFGMLREDYERFIEIFDEELSDRFILSAPKKGRFSFNRFIQVFRKDTVLDDGKEDKTGRPKLIYIDIFPLDFAPNSMAVRTAKGLVANSLMAIGGSVEDAYYMTDEFRRMLMSSKEGRRLYIIRQVLGKAFSWKTPKQWFEIIDDYIVTPRATGYITSATGRKHYLGEVVPADSVLPLKQVTFCDINLYAPSDPEVYLENLYGDYMVIPSEENRESHYAVELKTL